MQSTLPPPPASDQTEAPSAPDLTPAPTTTSTVSPPSPMLTTPPPQDRNAPALIAFILIALGALFLGINLFGTPAEAILFVIGIAFLLARITTGNWGLAIPAGILMGIGGYTLAVSQYGYADPRGGLFFMFFGMGWLAAYVFSFRFTAIWPLVLALAFTGFGAMLGGWIDYTGLAQYAWLSLYWPILLIVLGGWVLISTRLPHSWRQPAGAALVLALSIVGLLLFASTMIAVFGQGQTIGNPSAAAPWAGNSGPFSQSASLAAPMSSSDTLHIANRSGNVLLRTSATTTDQLQVRYTKHSWSSAAQPNVSLTRSGSTLTLETTPVVGGFLSPTSSVDFVIDMPQGAPVNIDVGSGSVQVQGQTGQAQVVTGSGDIQVSNTNATLTARTGSGNIVLNNVRGTVQGSTGSGNITGSDLQVGGNLNTGSGNIQIAGIFAADLVAHTSSGNVITQFAQGSSVHVDAATGSGHITVRGLTFTNQRLDARTLSGTLGTGAGTFRIETGSGNITLQ